MYRIGTKFTDSTARARAHAFSQFHAKDQCAAGSDLFPRLANSGELQAAAVVSFSLLSLSLLHAEIAGDHFGADRVVVGAVRGERVLGQLRQVGPNTGNEQI